VNQRPIFIVVVGVVAVGAFLTTLYLRRPAPAPSSSPAVVSEPAPAPPPAVVTESPPPAEAPTPETPPPAVARPPARKPAVPPAAAATTVAPAAPAEVATLRIDSDVAGAQVFIDREYIGVTPLTAQNVQPGTRRVNVSAEGYDGVAETIEVSPGARDVMIKLKEVRLNSRVEVVHKHRFGSCQGRLIATPQGLRYETTDKDDAFSTPLLDLETFEVDYLEKNLRIKPRKGKRYDFTDPDGNADRLFVFHRDTEKARARLKKGDPPG
jgi:hypothetical protein